MINLTVLLLSVHSLFIHNHQGNPFVCSEDHLVLSSLNSLSALFFVDVRFWGWAFFRTPLQLVVHLLPLNWVSSRPPSLQLYTTHWGNIMGLWQNSAHWPADIPGLVWDGCWRGSSLKVLLMFLWMYRLMTSLFFPPLLSDFEWQLFGWPPLFIGKISGM